MDRISWIQGNQREGGLCLPGGFAPSYRTAKRQSAGIGPWGRLPNSVCCRYFRVNEFTFWGPSVLCINTTQFDADNGLTVQGGLAGSWCNPCADSAVAERTVNERPKSANL